MSAADDLRGRVCAEARSWLGTPYHHHARVKGAGVDCVHFLCGVYEAVGILPPTDPGIYPQFWHRHRSEEVYAQAIDLRADRVQTPCPGDVVLWKFGRTHSHSGIYVGDGEFIHAFARHGRTGAVCISHEADGLGEREPWYWSIDRLMEL
jgi:NlpC/P60 family putative phage cell wall peptidase